ncbi:LPS export ABC transporter periplasmic protein LptC [Sulfurimonas sp.]|nr:LPS export ABC transporter periplasmic protein LptC [Sulfurimonas sp.]
MRINVFFLLVALVLSMIFFIFKPLDVQNTKTKNTSLFNLNEFSIYELDSQGLTTLMNGVEAIKYKDRWDVSFIDYTDNSKELISNMKANSGTYKDDNVLLKGDVVYFREDGLTFESQSGTYNKSTGIARSKGKFILHRGTNRAIGKKLKYNNSSRKIYSEDVTVNYKLKER